MTGYSGRILFLGDTTETFLYSQGKFNKEKCLFFCVNVWILIDCVVIIETVEAQATINKKTNNKAQQSDNDNKTQYCID